MRPIHRTALTSTIALLTAATMARAQDCSWDAIFEGIDPLEYEHDDVRLIATADFDGDGDIDTAAISFSTTQFSVLLNNGDAPPTILVSETPERSRGIATGDFDADGHIDLALGGNPDTGGTALHRGLGNGTFEPWGQLDFGAPSVNYFDIMAVDTNEDGVLDLVITDAPAGTIGVLHGNGDGTFAPPLVYPTGAGPAAIAAFDADGDGDVDLVTANRYDDDLSVLLNQGDGTFAPATNIAVGWGPTDVEPGDFDGDGIIDLAVAEAGDFTLSTLVGRGDGTFAPGATIWFPAGRPLVISSIDLDGDVYTDLAVELLYGATVQLFVGSTGAGDPGLAPGPTYPLNYGGGCQAVADMNADGIDDLVMHGRGYEVLTGRGDGTFDGLPALAMGGGPASATADMNGDGIADLLATCGQVVRALWLALGRGDGTFDAPMVFLLDQTWGHQMFGLAVGDIDDDGDVDAVVSTYPGVVQVLRNPGDGSLTIAETYDTGPSPVEVVLADLDEDGALDLIVAHSESFGLQIRRGNGDGTFAAPETLFLGNRHLAVADLDGDGHLDLLATQYDPADQSFFARRLGNGDGTFGALESFVAPPYLTDIACADLDEDGAMDVLLAAGDDFDVPTAIVAVYRGTGDGLFDPMDVFAAPAEFWFNNLAIDDFDGDGALDVAGGLLNDSTTFVFPGTGDGALETPIHVNSALSTYSIVAADFDGNGAADLAVTSVNSYQTTLHMNMCAGEPCPADTDGSGAVDVVDLVNVILAWGSDDASADVTGDGYVDVQDLVEVILAWGPCG